MPYDGILREGDTFFDGNTHRPFQEDLDGWRNTQNAGQRYFDIIQMASGILQMANELDALQRKVFELEQDKKMQRKLFNAGFMPPNAECS